jgi:hypothetical protein
VRLPERGVAPPPEEVSPGASRSSPDIAEHSYGGRTSTRRVVGRGGEERFGGGSASAVVDVCVATHMRGVGGKADTDLFVGEGSQGDSNWVDLGSAAVRPGKSAERVFGDCLKLPACKDVECALVELPSGVS